MTLYRSNKQIYTVVTKHDPPPIPLRGFDWSAWIDETLDLGSTVGYGPTELDAIKDLLFQMNDCVQVEIDGTAN